MIMIVKTALQCTFLAPCNAQAFPHPPYAPQNKKEQNNADFSLFYTYSIDTIILETIFQIILCNETRSLNQVTE
jgi:hypothetical protein